MKVYLSGPISLGGTLSIEEVERNRQKFISQKRHFESHGYEVLDPTVFQFPTWIENMEAAIALMSQADLVFFLDGWEVSIGCRIERAIARALRIAEL